MQSDLSEQGRAAARELGQQLPPPERIFSSPADRCLQTVDCLFGREPDQLDPRCLEIDLGWFCGLLSTEIAERDPQAWHDWVYTPARTRPGGGETLAELQERFVAGVRDIQAQIKEDEYVFLATHGGCLRTLVCFDRDAPLDMYPDVAMENLTMFALEGDRIERGGLNLKRVTPQLLA